MVAFAIVFTQCPFHFAATDIRNQIDALQNTSGIVSSATNIIDLAWSWILGKSIESANNIAAFDLVADLLTFITEDGVGLSRDGHVDEITQETVQLHTAMTSTGQTSAAKNTDAHPKITTIFLCDDVSGCF